MRTPILPLFALSTLTPVVVAQEAAPAELRRSDVPVIEPERLVHPDVEDFVQFIAYIGERYFNCPVTEPFLPR